MFILFNGKYFTPVLDCYDPGCGVLAANKKGSSRNSGKHRNKNADLIDDVRASKHI
ncbi:hypothetical protein [Pseudomonas chlororaphis]